MHKIIICGLNGVGKSTTARLLAERLHYCYLDAENYYFPDKFADNKYAVSRTIDDFACELLSDIRNGENVVFASVDGRFGRDIEAEFTAAVMLRLPLDERVARIRARSIEKFGDKVKPGGIMFEQEEDFIRSCMKKSEERVTSWLDSLDIPTIYINSGRYIDDILSDITIFINSLQNR